MDNKPAQVEILLSTYNGEEFLGEQLDSILAQSYRKWVLHARDDGSSDNTVGILEEYRSRHPDKIIVIPDGKNRLGASASFAFLLAQSSAPYIMFCDQDDVWCPEKIETTLDHMSRAEQEQPDLPVLVHTDLSVVDRNLQEVAGSFWKYLNLNVQHKGLKNLLVLNNVTGCSLMANRALVNISVPVPDTAVIHDWWLALVAAGLGVIVDVDVPLLKYRQHDFNEVGATKYSHDYLIHRLLGAGQAVDLMRRIVLQAKAFYSIYGDRLSRGDRALTRSFSSILDRGRMARIVDLLQYGLHCPGFFRKLGIYTLLVMMGKSEVKNE